MQLSSDRNDQFENSQQRRRWLLLMFALAFCLPVHTLPAQPAHTDLRPAAATNQTPYEVNTRQNYADGFLPPPLSQPPISHSGHEVSGQTNSSINHSPAAVDRQQSNPSDPMEQKAIVRPEGLDYQTGATSRKKMNSGSSQLMLTIGLLFGVLLLLAVLVKYFNKHTPLTGGQLPREALQLLGRKMLDQRHAIHYVRASNRILILGVSLEGIRTLGEITDPVEIDQICGLCLSNEHDSPMVRSFKMLLSREERSQSPVQIDQQHRRRQQQKQRAERKQTGRNVVGQVVGQQLSWETPEETDDVRFSSDDIADLQRTLQEAREQKR